MTLEEFFANYEDSRRIYDALFIQINAIGPAETKVTKSQIAFRRNKQFAWVWIPGKYLRGKAAPLVLSLPLPYRDASPRWKEIIEPSRGRFMHHLEMFSVTDIDDEVNEWIRSAWEAAG